MNTAQAQAMNSRAAGYWVLWAGISGALGVMAGAIGSHGLEGQVPETDLAAFNTGARLHLAHVPALLGVAWLASIRAQGAFLAGCLFVAGTLLFSGSLYVLGLTGSRALVLVTPLGGLTLIAAWLTLAYSGWRLAGAR